MAKITKQTIGSDDGLQSKQALLGSSQKAKNLTINSEDNGDLRAAHQDRLLEMPRIIDSIQPLSPQANDLKPDHFES